MQFSAHSRRDLTTPEFEIPFICWVRYHGRSEDLAAVFGWRVVYIFPTKRGIATIARRYWASILQTISVIREAPNVVAIMLPPPIILFVRPFLGKRPTRYIFDIHSGLLTDKLWKPLLWASLRLLRESDIILAHTDLDLQYFRDRVRSEVVQMQDPAITAHNLAKPLPNAEMPPADSENSLPFLLVFPSSGDVDEPLEVFQTAIDEFDSVGEGARVVVTGSHAGKAISSTKIDVPGYLSQERYVQLVTNATTVIALSTRPNILQRAAFEALIAGSRLVVADSAPLRGLLGDYAEYVDPLSAESVAGGIARARRRGRPTSEEVASVQRNVVKQESEQIDRTRDAIRRSVLRAR